jgi:hypothetical protein
MKTIIVSNRRAVRRALCTVLIGIAALWAAPRSALAQVLYVSQGNNLIAEYNATTGALINASFITGLGDPYGLLLSGNTLFVANEGDSEGTTIGEYNATTGAVINANFITGLTGPFGLALSGNTLFVSNVSSGTIGEYNATTGAVINANFITGLNEPGGLALSGNSLFVANIGGGNGTTVGEYNATTGAVINANFITGLVEPYGLLLSGNTLFVTRKKRDRSDTSESEVKRRLNPNRECKPSSTRPGEGF